MSDRAIVVQMRIEADRAIRSLLATYPDHQYEVLEAFSEALVGRAYSLGEDSSEDDKKKR